MKVITLWEPYATLISLGLKQIETRPWSTTYRGELGIHAATRKVRRSEIEQIRRSLPHLSQEQLPDDPDAYPYGKILSVPRLVDCLLMTEELIAAQTEQERALGFWAVGRYAWKLNQPCLLEPPIHTRGYQKLWNYPRSPT